MPGCARLIFFYSDLTMTQFQKTPNQFRLNFLILLKSVSEKRSGKMNRLIPTLVCWEKMGRLKLDSKEMIIAEIVKTSELARFRLKWCRQNLLDSTFH